MFKQVVDIQDQLLRESVFEAFSNCFPILTESEDQVVDLGNDHLVVLHNTTASSLMYHKAIGGMPSPSLGVTKSSTPFEGFGDITLIGTRNLANPEDVPTYDVDAWTARHPEVIYKPSQEINKQIMAICNQYNVPDEGQYLIEKINSSRKPGDLEYTFENSSIMYSIYSGAPLQVKPKNTSSLVMNNPEFVKRLKTGEFTELMRGLWNNWNTVAESPEAKQFAKLLEQYTDQYLATLNSKLLRDMNPYRGGELSFQGINALISDSKRIDQMELNDIGFNKTLSADQQEPYNEWCSEMAEKIMGHPYIKNGNKLVPVTADLISQKMGAAGKRGIEKSLTFSPGKVRAMTGIKFSDFMQMRNKSDMIASYNEIQKNMEVAEKEREAYRTEVAEYYKWTRDGDKINYWGAFDDSMQALAKIGKKAKPTTRDLRNALAADFKVNEIPEEILLKGLQALKDIKTSKVEYFEAKQQRPVKVNEFVGAVVPTKTPKKVVEFLQQNGLEVVTADNNMRGVAVKQLAAQLQQQRGDIYI